MYFWLVIGVLIGWFWLVFGVLLGYRRSYFGAFTALGAFGVLTAAALAIVLNFGPYWQVVYRTVLQPG